MFLVRKIRFPENFLFFNSGRGTLKWLLSKQSSILKKKLSVGMPCYACYSIYQSIFESNNEAILLDIDPLSFSYPELLNDKIKRLDVLVWINYFGFKYSNILKEIRTRFPNLIIFEDCSHVDLRDYLKMDKKEYHSDYAIFSFNFRKPITAGGGALLILNKNISSSISHIINNYKQLSNDKLSLKKVIHILIYNFSYNYIFFHVFNRLITLKRLKAFKVEELPIKTSIMNRTLKKLFYAEYLRESEKIKLENYTLNYFNNLPEYVKNYSFGSLSYYAVYLSSDYNHSIISNIDKYMLWENLKESYKEFNVEISEESYPLTFRFLYNFIFLPARFFKNYKSKEFDFHPYPIIDNKSKP
jgi:dTDP-4-amino-4,6-dideoxygalactose transaminase